MSKYKYLTLKQYDKNAPHIIVEGEKTVTDVDGEKKTVVACEAGMPTVAVRGIASWSP